MTNSFIPTLALTAGEPAGIGPDLCIQIAQQPIACKLVAIADRELLRTRAHQLQLPLQLIEISPSTPPSQHIPGSLQVLHVPLTEPA